MKDIQSDLRKIALSSSKLVLSGAREAGVPEREIDAIQERMKKWLHILESYAAKVDDIRATTATAGEKSRRVDMLLAKRDQERLELFG